ncbi:MAG: Type I secretion system, outer membrane component LapE [uncultured Sulfurovum sp.]|uniref:Type I secretion system, outer membrane component LapE n=1 Tax=uncultured Sulfurovum sp. TaxID=269237 RepID=A0A6S6SVH9_9BACT|nr:MAG: Type I secretion system, outer membrane component LapE [uncultured Sulfurovum sp.]
MFIQKLSLFSLLFSTLLFSSIENLTLQNALERLKSDNLELKISRFTEHMKQYDIKTTKGLNYGKLDASIVGMRSNDAGNVFGFKLQSREATFGDFGFAEFDMSGNSNPLPVEPKALNYPKSHTYYQSKISYTVPLYTGGKLTEYEKITKAMHGMSQYDTRKLYNEKVFQTKKTFYDISLINNYINNLSKIIKNITKLENTVENMKDVGYAKDIDLLEVQTRKAEVVSMYNQANLNEDLAYQFLSFLLNYEVSSIKKINTMAKLPSISISKIESNNIDIQKANLGLEMAGMALNIEKSNYLPQVGAFAEYSSADNSLWNEFSEKDSYTVGVQVNLNLFNGGIDSANLEKAKVNHLKVQNQVLLAKKGIALKVKKLHTEILNNDLDIKNFKKQLKFAKSVYANYKERYKEGLSSISDVLIKQSKEVEVLLKLLTIQNTRNTNIFELKSLLNEGSM